MNFLYGKIRMVILVIIDNFSLIESLERYKNNKIVILGHDVVDVDSIVSGYLLEKILLNKGFNACFCITDREISKESLDILKGYNFDVNVYKKEFNDDESLKYILVDHNERNLNGEIIAIIDHHPTLKNKNINLYFNKQISSTSLYLCVGNEELFEKEDIELAVLASMLDTASFNSTKAREEDKIYCINMCKKYNLDFDKLYQSGLYFTPLNDLKECSLNGLKKYNFKNKLVESSYVHINNDKDNELKIKKIIEILKEYRKKKQLEIFVFIVHNMSELKTTVYKIMKDSVKKINYLKYTSRGNDIIPLIEKELMEEK